jgi:hypothetical protein
MVRALSRKNLAAHIKEQVAVSFVIGVLSGCVALAAGQGVDSLGFGLAGSAAWVLVAAYFYRRRAPVELNQKQASALAATEAERDGWRDALTREREAREAFGINVELLDAGWNHIGGIGTGDRTPAAFLRLINHGEPNSFGVEIEAIDGAETPLKPASFPWPVRWRDTQGWEYQKVSKEGEAALLFAEADALDLKNSPMTVNPSGSDWRPASFRFVNAFWSLVGPVQLAGVMTEDGMLDDIRREDRVLRVRVKVTEETTGTSARFIVTLGFKVENGEHAPRMSVSRA